MCSICIRGFGALRHFVRRLGGGSPNEDADHRDQGQRHLGLHPDQRHLDHRQAAFPGNRPVQPGRQPAINVGVSVSPVGGAAQIKAMKEVAGSLRPGPFAIPRARSFAARWLDAASKARVGARRPAGRLLKQPQSQPMPLRSKWFRSSLGTGGHLDSGARRRPAVRNRVLDYMRASKKRF